MPSSGCNLFSCRLPTIWPDKNSSLTKKTRQKNASKFLNFRHFEPSKECCAQMCNWSKPISKLHIWTLKCTNFISFLLIFIFFIFSLSILLFLTKNYFLFPCVSSNFEHLSSPLKRISWLFECCWHTRNLWLALLQEGQRNSKLFLYILGKKFLRKGADFALLHFRKCVAWSEQALSISVRMFKLLSLSRRCSSSKRRRPCSSASFHQKITDDKYSFPHKSLIIVNRGRAPHLSSVLLFVLKNFGDLDWLVTSDDLSPSPHWRGIIFSFSY